MKDFDFYEVMGVIAPGMIIVLGTCLLFFPNQQDKLAQIANASIGGLGVGLLASYVVGQLLQAVGNFVENIWWGLWGGMPTDWIRTGKHTLLAETQRVRVQTRVRSMLKDDRVEVSPAMPREQWYSIARQIYATVAAAGRSARADKFNGIYGLCRGMAAAFLVLLVAGVAVDWRVGKIELILFLLMAGAIYRMHRFGRNYGREVFVQFLQASEGVERPQ